MGLKRIVILICSISTFFPFAHGRPSEPLNDFDSEIITNDVQQLYVAPTPRHSMENPVQRITHTVKVPVETSTEYKYKDIIEPYTMEVPKLHSIRHAAGTLYYSVGPQENSYEKRMEVYKDNFEIPMNRNLPSNVPPPKY